MSKRDAALALAAYDVKVFPVSPETKAPLTKHGHLDGTTNPDTIRQWWAFWPDAWPGMNLAGSGLVTVAPDSPEHLAEFQRRGLDTPAWWQSPGGPGHVHHVFRRPDGTPTTRICRSGEYDVMSDGYSIAYLSDAANVPNMNGGLPDAPAWVVDMLKDAAAKKAHKQGATNAVGDDDDDDDPPCVLADHDLAIWQAKDPKRKPDGSVDRSATLLKIGRVLFDAKVPRRWIMAALRDRDHRLGYHKYCCTRADTDRQYGAIVDELQEKGRSAIVTFGTQHSAAEEALERFELAHAREESVMRNPHRRVKAVARTAIVIARAWQGAEDGEGTKTSDGGVFIWVEDEIAIDAGVNKFTASRHLKRLEEWGLLTTRFGFRVKPSTGEVVRGKAIYLPDDAPTFLETLATFIPPPAEPREHRHCHPEARALEPELRDEQLEVPLPSSQSAVEIYGCRSRNSGSDEALPPREVLLNTVRASFKDPRDGFTTCALCKQVSRTEVCDDCERATSQTALAEPEEFRLSGRAFWEGLRSMSAVTGRTS